MKIGLEISGTYETYEPAFTEFVNHFLDVQRQSFDDDGGMHAAGVQMMLSYEDGQFTVDDLMMPIT